MSVDSDWGHERGQMGEGTPDSPREPDRGDGSEEEGEFHRTLSAAIRDINRRGETNLAAELHHETMKLLRAYRSLRAQLTDSLQRAEGLERKVVENGLTYAAEVSRALARADAAERDAAEGKKDTERLAHAFRDNQALNRIVRQYNWDVGTLDLIRAAIDLDRRDVGPRSARLASSTSRDGTPDSLPHDADG